MEVLYAANIIAKLVTNCAPTARSSSKFLIGTYHPMMQKCRFKLNENFFVAFPTCSAKVSRCPAEKLCATS